MIGILRHIIRKVTRIYSFCTFGCRHVVLWLSGCSPRLRTASFTTDITTPSLLPRRYPGTAVQLLSVSACKSPSFDREHPLSVQRTHIQLCRRRRCCRAAIRVPPPTYSLSPPVKVRRSATRRCLGCVCSISRSKGGLLRERCLRFCLKLLAGLILRAVLFEVLRSFNVETSYRHEKAAPEGAVVLAERPLKRGEP